MTTKEPAFYSVVQFVPDSLRDERINIGVIVVDETGSASAARFVRSWNRVQQFGKMDIDFVKQFVRDVESELSPQLPLEKSATRWSRSRLVAFSAEWRNSIQISTPRASTLDVNSLIEDVYARFVREPASKPRGFRDRRAASSLALKSITKALTQTKPDATKYVHPRSWLKGQFDEHQFDVVVQNGQPLVAAEGLSFEVPHSADLVRDVDAIAWALDDVHRAKKGVRLAVIAIPPKGKSVEYDRAHKIYKGLKAQFVVESEVEDWAEEIAALVNH